MRQYRRGLVVLAAAVVTAMTVAGCATEVSGDGQASAGGSGTAVSSETTTAMTQSEGQPTTESGSTESGSTDSGSTQSGSTESGSTESGGTESGSTEVPMPGGECATWPATDTSDKSANLSVSNGFVTAISDEPGDCGDTLRIEITGSNGNPGYSVRYVPQVVQDGSGLPVDLRGSHFLEVVIDAPTYDVDKGTATLVVDDDAELVSPASTRWVRQVASAGSFEGMSTFGIGLDEQYGFAVTVESGQGGTTDLVIRIG